MNTLATLAAAALAFVTLSACKTSDDGSTFTAVSWNPNDPDVEEVR